MKLKAAAVLSIGILSLACLFPPDSRAGGAGFYLTAGGGDAETDRNGLFTSAREDEESSHRGFGFTFDTNLNQPAKLFNYRMGVGYEKLKFEVDGGRSLRNGFETDAGGVVLEQDFGFGGQVAPSVRIWGGPCLRLSFHRGDDDGDNDYRFVGIGVGPVLGVDFGTGGPVTLSVRGGYLLTGYGGRLETPAGARYDYDAEEDYFFLTLGTYFGTGG
jgi:hypothetical protein